MNSKNIITKKTKRNIRGFGNDIDDRFGTINA